jgi:hypothetical protein
MHFFLALCALDTGINWGQLMGGSVDGCLQENHMLVRGFVLVKEGYALLHLRHGYLKMGDFIFCFHGLEYFATQLIHVTMSFSNFFVSRVVHDRVSQAIALGQQLDG